MLVAVAEMLGQEELPQPTQIPATTGENTRLLIAPDLLKEFIRERQLTDVALEHLSTRGAWPRYQFMVEQAIPTAWERALLDSDDSPVPSPSVKTPVPPTIVAASVSSRSRIGHPPGARSR